MAGKKILLVDDDRRFVDAVKIILVEAGYDVDVAYDGKEGGERVARQRPDLIILDVMMPIKDGYRLCAEIKNDPGMSDIPIILLTAVGENVHKTRYSHFEGMTMEAEEYIPKPVEPLVLLQTVKELVE